MKKEDLIELKKRITALSEQEQKERNIYLRDLSIGKLQGPLIGHPSVDMPWLKYYDEKIFDNATSNLSAYDFVIYNNKNNMEGLALEYFNKKYTYNDFVKKVQEVEKSLKNVGVKKGDIVTVAITTSPEYIFLFYALNKIGAIANIVDLRLKGDLLKSAINDVNSKCIFVSELFANNLIDILDETNLENVIIVSPVDSLNGIVKKMYYLKNKKVLVNDSRFETWSQFIESGKKYNFVDNNEDNIDETNEACILYTSGTTGKPKGVVVTNKAFNWMAYQYMNIGIDYHSNDRFMNQVPPFLAYNLLLSTHMPLSLGLDVVVFPNYEPEKFVENIIKHKINHVSAGPADWNNFLESKKLKNKDLSFLRTMGSGSDKIINEKKQEINEMVAKHNGKYKILEGYGMTEVGSAACTSLPNINVDNSVGVPLPKMSMTIIDPDDGRELSYDEIGEICISGPTMMKGYYNNKEATDEIKVPDECGVMWIHTGDLGYMNRDGVVFLSGRLKRLIIRHDGIKISPFDIEKVINDIEAVDSCCVVPIDDIVHGRGSVPCINVVLKENIDLSENDVRNLIIQKCKLELTDKYNVGEIIFVNELPLTPVGKVDYRKITQTSNDFVLKMKK